MEKKAIRLFGLGAVLLTICLSLVMYCFKYQGQRYIMLFRGIDSKKTLCIEERVMKKIPDQTDIQSFVNELLLGPRTEHYKFLFSPGTHADFCFVRNNVLYVNLSKEVLEQTGHTSEIKDGTEIFKENIFRNFRNIKEIEMFVCNKYVAWND